MGEKINMKNVQIMVKLNGMDEVRPLLNFVETRSLEIFETRDTKTIVVGFDLKDDFYLGVDENFREFIIRPPDVVLSNN